MKTWMVLILFSMSAMADDLSHSNFNDLNRIGHPAQASEPSESSTEAALVLSVRLLTDTVLPKTTLPENTPGNTSPDAIQ